MATRTAIQQPALPAFIDTNVLLYLVSSDTAKADRAEQLLVQGGVISVQVLNEFANVARRKSSLAWSEITDILTLVRRRFRVVPVTEAVHDRGMALVQRHALSLYDAMIVAAALEAGAGTLYSEDMQHGLRVERSMMIVNPFSP